jgi:MFS family permease
VPAPPPRPANHPNGTGTAPSGGDPAPRASAAATSASLAIAALAVAAVSNALMQTLVVPAIGVLAQDLDAGAGAATWVLTAFLLASAILAPPLSSMGDRYGKRRLLLVVLWVYLVGTLGAMLAWNLGALVGFRAVQGISLAVLPLGFAILREAVPADRVALGVGVTSGVLGAGAGIGLVAGGLIVDHASWRWLFALGAATAVVALGLVARHVPESTVRSLRRLDVAGSGVLALALTALLLALTVGPDQGWTAPTTLGLGVVSLAALVVLPAVERRATDPLLAPGTFGRRPVLMTHLAAFIWGFMSFVFYVLLPLLAQLPAEPPPGTAPAAALGFGASVTMTGLLLLPGALVLLPAGAAAAWVGGRLGPRAPLAIGLGVAAAGASLLAVSHATVWQVVVFYLVVGLGSGLALAALPRLLGGLVPATQTATVNGINTVARTVGGALGAQVAIAIVASRAGVGGVAPARSAFSTAFWLAAAVAAAGMVVARAITSRVGDRGRPGAGE